MTVLNTFKAVSPTLALAHPELQLLILFGSRARGEADPTSDWDFAVLLDADSPVEHQPFWFPGSDLLDTLCDQLQVSRDKIDFVDLSQCSDILAHFIARDGQVIYEKTPGEFTEFQQGALKTKAELKEFRQSQRNQVLQALQRWGV